MILGAEMFIRKLIALFFMCRLKASASSQHENAEGARKLTMYKNGIVIDDGPFR